MPCPNMKRKFEEVEEAVHSSIETLTGYEKCLLQNELLQARSKMVKYENLVISYETQVRMAKVDVEIATSDLDLLLEDLQRGKRFKTDFHISSDRLVYDLYKDIQAARCQNYITKKSEHRCAYCGPVNEGHICFFSLKKILEQC